MRSNGRKDQYTIRGQWVIYSIKGAKRKEETKQNRMKISEGT